MTGVGGSAALLLSVPQDWALPLAATVALLIVSVDRLVRADCEGLMTAMGGKRT